jgi:hypothetical protein
MAGVKGRSGGARPGAGRPKANHKLKLAAIGDVEALLRRELAALPQGEDRHATRTLTETLTRIADAQEDLRELLRRGLLDLRRHAGLVEEPKMRPINRHRPLE